MATTQEIQVLAEKIIDNWKNHPEMIDEHKADLVQTMQDVYAIAQSEKAGNKAEAAAEAKSLFMSKTFWGLVMAGVGLAAPHFGVHFTQDQLVANTGDMVGIVGIILGIYGRIVAAKTIK